MKHKSIASALKYVSEHSDAPVEITLDMPMWEVVCRELFDIANRPNHKVRGANSRATKAQKLIYSRMAGKRRPGTHPAQTKVEEIEFKDLTAPGEISV